MLFNSFSFAFFLPVVFIIYWYLNNYSLKIQNVLLLFTSYLFYAWWDWRFLSLIIASSAVDYLIGVLLFRCKDLFVRRCLLLSSLIFNLGILFFFKYFNFFLEELGGLLQSIDLYVNEQFLYVALPIGISFYTFQTLSYTIDVYRHETEPTTDLIAFFAYVSFFPQLVAGPIERSHRLLPQFLAIRKFDYFLAKDGLRQILWGVFKKVVIADNLALYVDLIYSDYEAYDSTTLILGTLYFALQIYCDFSGYSDIAIGTARLFGFDLMQNFSYPYFSRNIAEFWRNWHISLSTWFRDYVYIPLGGSKTDTKIRHFANLMVTFTLSGLWHGANWTFIVWGFLNGLYYFPLIFFKHREVFNDEVAPGRILPTIREFMQISSTFILILFSWIFFRSPNITYAFSFIEYTFTNSWLKFPDFEQGLRYVLVLLCIEWIQRGKKHALQIDNLNVAIRWCIYYIIIISIIVFRAMGNKSFIYFQF